MEYPSISIHKIKRGDLFWESEGGRDALFIAVSDARYEHNGVGVEAREIPTGKPQHFFEGERGGAYGPRLYNQPQYTRPDWPALLIGLATVLHNAQTEAEKQAAAREEGLKLAATQYSESRDAWQTKAKAAEMEIARLNSILDKIEDVASQKVNGVTMAGRLTHVLRSR